MNPSILPPFDRQAGGLLVVRAALVEMLVSWYGRRHRAEDRVRDADAGCRRHRDPVGAGEGAEVVIERPVLLHDEDEVLEVGDPQRRVDRDRRLFGPRRGGSMLGRWGDGQHRDGHQGERQQSGDRAGMHGVPMRSERARGDLERWVAWRPTPRRSPHEPERRVEHHDPGHAHPRRRDRPRVRGRRATDRRGRRRDDRVGEARGRRGGLQAGPALRASRPRRSSRSPARASSLKGPLETPVGFGEKSANVTLRKLFETYANIRPVRELPGVTTPYSGRGIDLVVVRENVEDLYAGIEHMQTPGVAECLKLISREGLREDRPVRVRVRPRGGPQERRLRDQGEHHEADRGHCSSAPSRRSPRSTRTSSPGTSSSTTARTSWSRTRSSSTSSSRRT